MPDKAWNKLNALDRELRSAYPVRGGGAAPNGVRVSIRMFDGFELFNTRPYHNYETWSDGYEATDGEFYVRAEDLDDCIGQLCSLRKSPESAKPWMKVRPEMLARFGWPVEKEESDG